MVAALCFAPYALAPVSRNQNRKAHATDCHRQLEEFLFDRGPFVVGSVSHRGSDLRVASRTYPASRQSEYSEILILSATSVLQSEFCVFARVGRLQLLCVGTADHDRWRFDKRGRYHFLELRR